MYGVAFVGFSATVLYPLVTGTRDADAVFDDFGVVYGVNAALAFAGGVLFGASVFRARVFPTTWTGPALIAGLVLTALLAGLGLPEEVQTVGTAIRSVAFAGMDAACLSLGSGDPPEKSLTAVGGVVLRDRPVAIADGACGSKT